MYFTELLIILVLFLLLFASVQRLNHGKKGKLSANFPPGPKPLPIIGSLLLLDLKRPQKTFIQLSKKYGSIYSIQLGMKKIVVLTGYDTVKDALVNHADEFAGRAILPIFKDVFHGVGITFSNGDNWKAMRRFTLSTLRDFGMGKRTIENKIIEESEFLVDHYRSHGGKPFDVTVIMNAASANIITSIVLGHRFSYDHPTLLMLTRLVNETAHLIGSPIVNLYNMYPVLRFLPGNHKTVVQNKNDMHAFLRKSFLESLEDLQLDDKRHFIDAFLIKEKEEKNNSTSYFNESNLLSTLHNLFNAGIDTTSSTLRWGLALMIKYPCIQRKVQEEIEAVIGSEQPNVAHRKLMPYTDAVIHEVQRFGNIAPLNLPHETTVDTTFRGYFIPKGTRIIPLLESVLKDKTQFEKPEEFYPQHFLDFEGKFVKKDAFMPFGTGRRVCIGQKLAKMELFVYFTSLLQKFTFTLPPGVPDIDLTPIVGFTTPPVPYQLCAIPRS